MITNQQTSPQSNTNQSNSPPSLKLKIEDHAYKTLLYFRDYRPDEVTMFGISSKDNLLYVENFALVKQKVNSVSSDCDTEGMMDHICKYHENGINPLRCERIWFHTHPMTGDKSATPSGKDMNTWTDSDNNHKNFMIMGIVSKSGHYTCRIRIKTNISQSIEGLDFPFIYEQDIPIEIIKTDKYKKAVLRQVEETCGQRIIESLGEDEVYKIFADYFNIKQLFPAEIIFLENEYARLVTKDIVANNFIGFNNNTSNNYHASPNEKKNLDAKTIPEYFAHVGLDVNNVDDLLLKSYNSITSSSFAPCDENHIRKSYGSYLDEWQPHESDYVSTILGAINADLIRFSHGTCKHKFINSNTSIISLDDKKQAVRRSLELYPTFIRKLAELI